MTYAEQIQSPRWQKKRLEILQRDNFTCQECGNKKNTLHVHHIHYLKKKMIWDYPDKLLITLCKDCHENIDVLYNRSMFELLEVFKQLGFTPGAISSFKWYIYEGEFDPKEHIEINLLCRGNE